MQLQFLFRELRGITGGHGVAHELQVNGIRPHQRARILRPATDPSDPAPSTAAAGRAVVDDLDAAAGGLVILDAGVFDGLALRRGSMPEACGVHGRHWWRNRFSFAGPGRPR